MLVYRVEHKDTGGGCYRSRNEVAFPLSHYHADKRPTPYKDKQLTSIWSKAEFEGYQHLYIFGFVSMKQYESWFCKRDRRLLQKAGFVLKKYKVRKNHVHASKYQCIFNKHKAEFQEFLEIVA
jgi:hypothetical protein